MRLAITFFLALAACSPAPKGPPHEDTTTPSPAGLVRLPCRAEAHLKSANSLLYCARDRHWATPAAQAMLRDVADKVAAAHPGSVVMTMEASWPSGKRPMPPHLSHGDGREIDVALFYETRAGKPLPRPPTTTGYYAFEPRRAGDPDPCVGRPRPGPRADPPADRAWRLDEARTRTLIRALLDDRRVRRLLLEPHLKQRLGFAHEERIRFPWLPHHAPRQPRACGRAVGCTLVVAPASAGSAGRRPAHPGANEPRFARRCRLKPALHGLIPFSTLDWRREKKKVSRWRTTDVACRAAG